MGRSTGVRNWLVGPDIQLGGRGVRRDSQSVAAWIDLHGRVVVVGI